MHIQHIYQQGQGLFNEDALILNPTHHIYGVVDGVSGLQAFHQENTSSGQIAARIVSEHFNATNELLPTLSRISIAANDQLRHTMLEAKVDIHDVSALWSAVHAVVQIQPHYIDWVQSGDCMIYAIYDHGLVRTLTYDSVDIHDERALHLWYQKYNAKLIHGKKPDEVTRTLQRNRQLANQPSGYSVMNGQPEFAQYIESGRIARNELRHLLLITDGIYPWLPAYPASKGNPNAFRHDFIEDIVDFGLSKYVEQLCTWEAEDKACLESPRFKVSDDKTGILITF
ncbi:hypothetical protein BVG16_15945 [Paenibacillus selenitireducens]|uniref:PPM-type phosphatase domain-containing protein n=1 Tax=Paenibacillus selenitireducens TaxID=1324314 RepID=A0A1T2XAP0_9BACL|nr:protein phosphatase 2C domain-containing protein [Paenibacillus selenitireducens]OPA76663.1 hypothetical protein BVG16_15945 [Paenibacillus selenitireducens]